MKVFRYLLPAAAGAGFAAAASGFAGYAMSIKPQTLEEAYEWQKAHYDVSWYKDTDPTEYTIKSYDGYELHAVLMKSLKSASEQVSKASAAGSGSSSRYVICSHGYTDNRYGTLKYAKIFLDLGYNVIAYDLRGHGKNERTFCTYTVREAKDLARVIEDTYRRCGKDILLGLHGESLGAATSVAVLKYTQKPSFVVADCGFADIGNVLLGGLRAMNPALTIMLKPASLAAKIRYGYSYDQMRPIDSLKENHVPILFLHGADDDFILPENSERMSKATKGYSELHLIPGAVHAKSVLTEPEMYRNYVAEFITRAVKD